MDRLILALGRLDDDLDTHVPCRVLGKGTVIEATTENLTALTADFHDHMSRDANACVYLGLEKRLDELPDPSEADAAACVAEAGALLGRLDAIDASALPFNDRLDLDLMRLMLQQREHDLTYTFNGRTQRQQLPSAGDDIGEGIFQLFVNDPRPAGDRLANITARLEQVPAYLAALRTRLDEPVARWTRMDLDKIKGLPDFLANLAGWAQESKWADRPRLVAAIEQAETAMVDYTGYLDGLPTTDQFHVGDATARRIVALNGMEKTLEELHEIARGFMTRTGEIIESLRGRLIEKYDLDRDASALEVHEFLKDRYRPALAVGDANAILGHYESERTRILAFIERERLFPIPDDQEMKIIRTPTFMEPTLPAGAMLGPAPFRKGTATSIIYLTVTGQIVSELSEIGIASMMVHEGIPGHHLQLAHASRNASIVRRHADYSDLSEGWTTMLEDFMLDAGFMQDTADEARFLGKREISRLGARVAIDLFFMTGDRGYLDIGVDCDRSSDDPFEAAGNLLSRVTGFTSDHVRGELNWYSQERGYPLSYLAGNNLTWALKNEVIAANRGHLEERDLDRVFHDTYLEAGNMPMSFLRRVFAKRGLI